LTSTRPNRNYFLHLESNAVKNIKNIKNELKNRDKIVIRQQIIIRKEEGYDWNNGSFAEFSGSANGDPVAKSILLIEGLAVVRETSHPEIF